MWIKNIIINENELTDEEIIKLDLESKKLLFSTIFDDNTFNTYIMTRKDAIDADNYANLLNGIVTEKIKQTVKNRMHQKVDFSLPYEELVYKAISIQFNSRVLLPMIKSLKNKEEAPNK